MSVATKNPFALLDGMLHYLALDLNLIVFQQRKVHSLPVLPRLHLLVLPQQAPRPGELNEAVEPAVAQLLVAENTTPGVVLEPQVLAMAPQKMSPSKEKRRDVSRLYRRFWKPN